jgi:molybdopterin-containing oxidoreductase family iron-sulfur binding subunit
MSSLEKNDTARRYWRSLDELSDTPEYRQFVEKEFPDFAGEMLSPPDRRTFMKLMGASAALAGMTACRWPQETIVPWSRQPQGRLPGVPVQYATAWEFGGHGLGLLVTSYDGRPIKVDGNPEHPASLGAASSFMQALVLEMYDPDRSRFPLEAGVPRNWEDFDAAFGALTASIRARQGAGTAILCEASSSPTMQRLAAKLREVAPQLRWFEYEPVSRQEEQRGTATALGSPMRPHWMLERADVIISLDSDFLWDHPNALRYAREYAAGRKADDGRMNRLHVLEPVYTITGAAADHRYALKSSEIAQVAIALAGVGSELPSGLAEMVTRLRQELETHRGRAVVIAGQRQPAAVHAAVARINELFGNLGYTVFYTADPTNERGSIQELAAVAPTIENLLILGGNPAYNAPADVNFAGLLKSIKTSIHLSLWADETSMACSWHVPQAHVLESWGDVRAWDGTMSVSQPLIEPLYGGRTAAELVGTLAGEASAKSLDLVRATHAALDEKSWRRALHDGLVAGSAWAMQTPQTRTYSADMRIEASTGLEVVFVPDYSVYDGRFANNAWLQENPDPLSKLVWDNAALISYQTGKQLGIKHGKMTELNLGGTTVTLPVYVMPGMAKDVVALPLGYGRQAGMRVAQGVGFDVYPLRTSLGMTWLSGGSLQEVSSEYTLVSTQDHWAIDEIGVNETQRRIPELVREGTLAEYKANREFAAHGEVRLFNLWSQEHTYPGHRWGLAIDLTACIGCGACTVACQAENNIPVVGKEQVRRGREMHWIRLDRYFRGNVDHPAAVFQPVTCMHCENAPCEQVCPVAATVHDREGLNVMVYNRCIGTRYCSNNCPYKVRRFNYYNWHNPPKKAVLPGLGDWRPAEEPIQAMVYNPEVTVRTRGVMEKCTYCLQRINQVKIVAKNEQRPIRDGEIVTACQQTCPTQAIVFGDLNDEQSKVRQWQQHPRVYAMLQELNVRPRTQYLARLKNPAGHALPAAHTEGHA